MMYVAIPVRFGDSPAGISRASVRVEFLDAALGTLKREVGLGVLLVLVAAALVSLWMSQKITKPLGGLVSGARRFAEGGLDHSLVSTGPTETAVLAETMNQMASQLKERIEVSERQSQEYRAVLRSMSEGVIAVRSDQTIISVNRAAARLLDVEEQAVKGRFILEVVRSGELRAILQDLLRSRGSVEKEVRLWTQGERVFKCNCTTHPGSDADPIRMLVVFEDVTRLKALESLRRDFTANVSHEFKTPLSSIKGYLETLLDDSLNDPARIKKFLSIIERHAHRLEALIDDLLMLSRIELMEDTSEIGLTDTRLLRVLDAARSSQQQAAVSKSISVEISCQEDDSAWMNEQLMITAVSNLIKNAIHHTPEAEVIEVGAGLENEELVFFVKDRGPGVPDELRERLFHRFFRVDKARSGKDGGPGLGLAIVRHIAQAHGGTVEIANLPEGGSVFQIVIPRSEPR
jgi:two-component system phosphate regulon sensor histidine kinase PhoR